MADKVTLRVVKLTADEWSLRKQREQMQRERAATEKAPIVYAEQPKQVTTSYRIRYKYSDGHIETDEEAADREARVDAAIVKRIYDDNKRNKRIAMRELAAIWRVYHRIHELDDVWDTMREFQTDEKDWEFDIRPIGIAPRDELIDEALKKLRRVRSCYHTVHELDDVWESFM